ncbi:MAG: ABC transporter ATP-binding protein [Nocardioidaceae bacterium]|nr:ABC transporter ATP-binding protein [Nocardioidaceae bacterium]
MTSDTSLPLLEGRDLTVSFGETSALRGATITVGTGEIVALMGPSGSGKSTLLHCLAGVLVPDAGSVRIGDLELSEASERKRSAFRLRWVGFVFQFGDLVPELTLVENVALPLQLNGVRPREADARARSVMADLGVLDVADRRAGAVAGGQAQRAAVARALVHRPKVIFADEPTGSLDTVAGEAVLDALVSLARDAGTSVLIVTHDNRVAAHADRLVTMRDGCVVAPDMASVR